MKVHDSIRVKMQHDPQDAYHGIPPGDITGNEMVDYQMLRIAATACSCAWS